MMILFLFIYGLLLMIFHHVYARSTVVEFRGVSKSYHFQKALFLQNGIPDPLLKMKKKNLLEICQEVRQSSTYRMVKYDHNGNLPDDIKLDENYYQLPVEIAKLEEKEIKYYLRQSLLQDQTKKEIIATLEENILSCATKEKDHHFHLTYGYLDGYFFIFNHVYSFAGDEITDEGIKLVGVVEPTPDLMEFRDQQHMEKVFMNTMHNLRQKTLTSPTVDKLCTLNATQQFRLCSVVHNAKNPSTVSINYAREVGYQCIQNQLVAVREIDTSKYLIKKPRVNAIPCYINNESTPQFYLTYNFSEEYSVFILTRKPEGEEAVFSNREVVPDNLPEEELILGSAVRNISVLRYAQNFY